jgi:ribosome-binding protein aMBF1 (putative translation factor)
MKKKTASAVELLHRRYYHGRPRRAAMLDLARINDCVAREIRDLRENAGLTQRQLAQRVGTSTSAISRLEDADYNGHSLSMLKRIAVALEKRLEVHFV